MPNEEGVRAALIGPNKAEAGETLHGVTAPAFSASLHPPVLELAVRLGLQPSAQFGRPGSIPGWGITFTPSENRCDNSTKCPRRKSRSAERVNRGHKRSDWSLKAIRKKLSPNSSRSRPPAKFSHSGNMLLLIAASFQQIPNPEGLTSKSSGIRTYGFSVCFLLLDTRFVLISLSSPAREIGKY